MISKPGCKKPSNGIKTIRLGGKKSKAESIRNIIKNNMDKNNLSDKYAKILTTQEYGKNPPIDGVKFIPLPYQKDDTGEFSELGRIDNGIFAKRFRFQNCPNKLFPAVAESR